jgi:hypothetical protein
MRPAGWMHATYAGQPVSSGHGKDFRLLFDGLLFDAAVTSEKLK